MTDLARVGITGPMETLEGPSYRAKFDNGRDGFSNNTIVLNISVNAGRITDWTRRYATCDASGSLICDDFIEAQLAIHDTSLDLEQRDQISKDIQRHILEEFIVVPTYINAFVFAAGPNVVGDIKDYFRTPLAPFPYPWDDWLVKE